MRASPSPSPVTQCEWKREDSASAADFGRFAYPHNEANVAGLFGLPPQLRAGP
jgi:hypothetical protein